MKFGSLAPLLVMGAVVSSFGQETASGAIDKWEYDSATQTIYNAATGERLPTEAIEVRGTIPRIRLLPGRVQWRPSGSIEPLSRRASFLGEGEIRGPVGNAVGGPREQWIGNPLESSPSFRLRSEDLVHGLLGNEIEVHRLTSAALFSLYTTLDSAGKSDADPHFVSAVLKYAVSQSRSWAEKEGRSHAGNDLPLMGKVPLIGPAIEKVFDEQSRAEGAANSYQLSTFVEAYNRAVANAIRELHLSKHSLMLDVAQANSATAYLNKEALVLRYDSSQALLKSVTAETAFRDLASAYISASVLRHGERGHIQVYVDSRMRVTRAVLVAPGGEKLADRLNLMFPKGVDISSMNVERRIIMERPDSSVPAGAVVFDADGYVRRLGIFNGSSELKERFSRDGWPFLTEVQDLRGKEGY